MCHTEGEAGARGAGPAVHLNPPQGSTRGSRRQRQQAAVHKVGASRAGKIASSLSSAMCDTTTEGLASPLGIPATGHWWGQLMGLQRERRRDCSALGKALPQGSVVGAVPLDTWRRQWSAWSSVSLGTPNSLGWNWCSDCRSSGRTGRPPRLLLGLVPSTAGTHSRLCSGRRKLVVQGEFLRPGKMTRVSFWIGKGHLHQPYFIKLPEMD